MKLIRILLLAAVACISFSAHADETRDPRQVALFRASHPCPLTGKTYGSCQHILVTDPVTHIAASKSMVVDHIKPLCAGGADAPSNMQWQELQASYAKDGRERKLCNCLKKQAKNPALVCPWNG